jgi:phospholipid transport system substrate-binding protein
MHRLLSGIVLLILVGISTVSGAAVQSPQALIKDTSEKVTTALRENKTELQADNSKLYGLVQEIVLPHFDFTLMSRWVLGKYWRQATAEQRRQFVDEFRTLLVRSYAGALLEYADEEITFPPSRELAEDAEKATVRSMVELEGQESIPITYSLRRRDEGWKVYDVKVDGISLIINYRSTFANQIRDDGIDAVISDLSQRNAKGGAE